MFWKDGPTNQLLDGPTNGPANQDVEWRVRHKKVTSFLISHRIAETWNNCLPQTIKTVSRFLSVNVFFSSYVDYMKIDLNKAFNKQPREPDWYKIS